MARGRSQETEAGRSLLAHELTHVLQQRSGRAVARADATNIAAQVAARVVDVVPNEARAVPLAAAISNSFGFGGQSGVLAFTRV